MKTLKKGISLLLIVALVCGMSVTAFADDKAEFHYVSLGTSITSAFGMRYYMDPAYYENPSTINQKSDAVSGYRNNVENSYPALICKELEKEGYDVDWDQLAQSSMRCEELRMLLDDNYKGDAYTAWRFYNGTNDRWWKEEELASLRQDYRSSIAEADLITYEMGVNNFGVYLINRVLSKEYDADYGNIVPQAYADYFYSLRDKLETFIVNKINNRSILTKETFEEIDFYVDAFAYAMLGFVVNFDATVKKICELNPDCNLVVLAIPNLIGDFDLHLDQLNLSLTDLYELVLKLANTYISKGSPYSDRYLYVDPNGSCGRVTCFLDEIADYDGNPENLSQNILDCFNVYDDDLMISSQIAGVVEPQHLDAVLKDVYHAAATIFKEAANINHVSVEEALASFTDLESVTGELTDGIQGIILEAAFKSYLPLLVPGTDISTLATPEETVERFIGPNAPEARRLAAAIAVRLAIGNSFFAHPNEAGHKEIFEAVWNAWTPADKSESSQIPETIKVPQIVQSLASAAPIHEKVVDTIIAVGNEVIRGVQTQCAALLDFWKNTIKKAARL